jgi:hypothetical protein
MNISNTLMAGLTMRYLIMFFNTTLSPEKSEEYTNEKEGLYRELYAPHIKPCNRFD